MEKTPASLIVLLPIMAFFIEFICYIVFKEKINRVVTLQLSPRRRKILRGLSLLELYTAYSSMPAQKYLEMKLKLNTSSPKTIIGLLISTIHSIFPILLALISIVALFTTTINNKLELTLPELIAFYKNDLNLVSHILTFYITLAFAHLSVRLMNASKSHIIKKHLAVINEIEKEQPITVRLSEDQYRALSTSSGLRRNVYQFGRSENL